MQRKSNYLFKLTTVLIVSTFSIFPVWAADNQVIANGTTVNLNGNQPPGPPSTTSNSTPALEAENNGIVNANGTTVTTTGNGSYGVWATTGGKITLNGGTVSTTGATDLGTGQVSWGLFANANGVINANGTFITTTGANAAGVVAGAGSSSPGTINLSGANINTSGTQAQGIVAATGGTVTLGGSTIQTSGTNAAGILALGGTITGAANVTTTNTGSAAISAISGNITYTGGSIVTHGSTNAYAFSASSSGTIVGSGFSAQTTGANSAGAFTTSGGSISLSSASLQTFGSGSAGLVAQSSGSTSLINGSVTTSGASASALAASNGGTINLTNASATAQGANSYGLSVDNSAGTTANTVNITNASLHSNSADAIHIDTGSVTVNANQGTINAGSNGVLVSAINGGVGNINGDNHSQFSGTVNNTASTVNMSLTNDSTWNGSASSLSNLNIDSSSRWNMTASSTVTGTTTLAGTINFNTPTPTQSTLTFNGPLIGQGGNIVINTTLNGDPNSPSDLIKIGDSSQGSTGITVNNFNGLGEPTDQGILVVNGINGGVVGTDSFHLTNPVIAGPYEYLLFRNGNNLYLRNTANEGPGGTPDLGGPNEGPGDPPDGGFDGNIIDGPEINPNEPTVPIYRPEVSLTSALPALGLLYDKALLGTLHQRTGQPFYLNDPDTYKRKWLRYIYNGGMLHNGSIYQSGPNFDYTIRIVQAGADVYNAIKGIHHFIVGVFGAIGNTDSNVDAPFVTTAGHNQVHGLSFGGYFTYQNQNRWYIDTVLQGTQYRFDANSYRESGIVTNGTSFAASIEGGYRYPFLQVLAIQPQAQFVAQTLALNNTSDSAADIQFRRANPYSSRVGLLGEYAHPFSIFDPLTIWLRGNYWHQFNGNTQTLFSSGTGYIPFTSPLAENTLEAEFGFTAKIFKTSSVYGTVSRSYFMASHGNATTAILGFTIAI